jgi:hypothetical protein
MSDDIKTEEAGKATEEETKVAVSDETQTGKVEDGKSDDATPAIDPEEYAQLKASYEKLQKKLDEQAKADEARKAKELEQKGEWQELAKTEREKREQIEKKLEQQQRRSEVDLAVMTAEDLRYSTKAVLEMTKTIDTETGGELEPGDLIKKAQERLEEWGLSPAADGTFTGGGGSSTRRSKGADDRVEKLRQLWERASSGDRQAEQEYYHLEKRLKDEKVKIPAFH